VKKPVAVIDIGSSAIRMVVAEIGDGDALRRLDRVGKPVALGKDVFVTGFLSSESMRQTIRILSGFREVISGWGISDEDVRIIATSAIREAKNRDTFLDRVLIQTGFRVDIVEGVEENHLTYLAVQHAVRELRPAFSRTNSLIIEVGGGTTEIMLLGRGKMVAAHSLRIGTVRLEQQMMSSADSSTQLMEYLRESIRVTNEILNAEMPLERIKYFVAVGGDARLVASQVGTKEGDGFSVVGREAFTDFVRRFQSKSVDQIVGELNVTYNEAEGLLPALMVIELFLQDTAAEQLIVPDVSIREGVLLSFALGTNKAIEKEFYGQVIASAQNIGRKYRYDENHGVHVAKLGLQIFDQFRENHGMGSHERMLLEVAAILHDIGNYIRASGHHKHGQYIVANSEIFGLSRSDIRVVSHIVRYHRKGMPNSAHTSFVALRREERVNVLKLSAILRIADALDRSHSQRVQQVELEQRDDTTVLRCRCSGDLSVERYGLSLKGGMFEEVFGFSITME
jgi:exopolyphosphatase / guanosine-5'-triphosphate,3'-diphosphate pyrophosphatase